MIKQEWNYLLKNKILLLVFLAIIAIPTIYTTLFLGSMWDPYGKVDSLPVAVVNHDKPVPYESKELNIGKQMVDTLKENDSLDFSFVNDQKAAGGLTDGSYYMVITIPEDFSANAATVLASSPKEMELKYETNPGTNYIASKLSETALSKIRTSIANSVTKVYAETVFDQVGALGEGMTAASDGSAQIKDGSGQLADGNTTITANLTTLADSTLTFKDGSETLAVGLKKYTDGVSQLNTGARDLKNGLQTLNTSTATLSGGAAALADGAGQLNNGVASYTTGVAQAQSGAKALAANNATLSGGISQLQQGVATLSQNSAALNGGIAAISGGVNEAVRQLSQGTSTTSVTADTAAATADTSSALSSINNAMADNESAKNAILNSSMDESEKAALVSSITQTQNELDAAKTSVNSASSQIQSLNAPALVSNTASGTQDALAALNNVKAALDGYGTQPGLVNAVKSYTDGVAQIQSAVGTNDAPGALTQGIQDYMSGTESLSAGMEKLDQNSSALSDGAASVNIGLHTLKSQTPSLTAGVEQLYLGSLALNNGTNQLLANNSPLLSGSVQLTDGAGKINSGAGQLAKGSAALGDGISKVSDGADTLSRNLSDGAQTVNSITADDKSLKMFADPVKETETTLTTVENNGHAMAPYMMSVALWVAGIAFSIIYPLTKYRGELKSGLSWWASKASILIIVAFLDAIVMVGALYLFNGFKPQEMGKTIFVACLASISFMAIMYFFNVALGKVGSFLMLIYMVIQLSGAAGTYPVELSGTFVSKIHYFLPFTYTVDAFRSTISGGESILPCVIMLLILLIVFSSLTIFVFKRRAQKIQTGKPLLMDFLEAKGLA